MGDIVEITSGASQPLFFYKVSGNGMWFDVKTRNRAMVGLAKDTCGRCQYWIEISNPGLISFETYNVRTNEGGLPFTLSQDEYSRFWVAWDSKLVWAGIGNRWNIAISSPLTTQLNYITFTTKDPSNLCSFKFEVSPLSLRLPAVPDEPKITAGKLQWKQCDDQLPDEAVIGGYIDGEVVYIVRAHHRQSLTPGVFVPSKGLAFIPWGGSDNPTPNFEALCGLNLKWKMACADKIPPDSFVAGYSEVNHEPLYIGRVLYQDNKIPGKIALSHKALCGLNFKWKPASATRIPVDAFVAGYSEINDEPLYIGRVLHQDNKIPGKVQLSHKTCYIAHQGREIAVKNFEVLTEPGLNVHCEHECVRRWSMPQQVIDLNDFNNDSAEEEEEALDVW